MARKKKPDSGSKKRRRRKKARKRARTEVEKGTVAAPIEESSEAPTSPEAAEADVAMTTEEEAVVDLDAEASDDDVGRLIAETVAMAHPEEVAAEPEEPPIDLDAAAMAESQGATAENEVADAGAEAEPAHEAVTEAVASGAGATPADAAPGEASSPDATAEVPPEQAAEALRGPIDLGPVSSPEARDRLLAEALAHAEHQDARYRVPFPETRSLRRWKTLAGFVLLLTAGTLAVAPPDWARPEPPAELGSAERARNLRAALLLQAQQVEAFRVRTGRLPMALGEVTATLPGVRYVRSGSRAYQLTVYDPAGNAVVYDSVEPTPAFDEIATVWTTPAVGP